MIAYCGRISDTVDVSEDGVCPECGVKHPCGPPPPKWAKPVDRLLAVGVLPEALRIPLADYSDRIEAALEGRL